MNAERTPLRTRPVCVHCQMLAFATTLAAAFGSATVLTLAPSPAIEGTPMLMASCPPRSWFKAAGEPDFQAALGLSMLDPADRELAQLTNGTWSDAKDVVLTSGTVADL